MAKFLVNKINDVGTRGETTDMRSILHNLMIIGPKYKEGFMNYLADLNLPYAIQICICGRFIVYIEVPKDLHEGLMKFYDLQNDNDNALDAAAEIKGWFFSTFYFQWFMEEFERLKEVYSDNYDAAELVLVENAGLLLN